MEGEDEIGAWTHVEQQIIPKFCCGDRNDCIIVKIRTMTEFIYHLAVRYHFITFLYHIGVEKEI